MKFLAALTATLALPSLFALSGPLDPAYAAATCQGQPATIEGTGRVVGTPGDDVIVATGPDSNILASGGNDVVCLEDGSVSAAGTESVLGTSATGYVVATLVSGDVTYTGLGTSEVHVGAVTSVDVTLVGGGEVWLESTRAGTGSVDLGTSRSYLYAFGLHEATVDLVGQTATVDGLHVTLAHVANVVAAAERVRVTGTEHRNDLSAYGCHTVLTGGGGRDALVAVGNGWGFEPLDCHSFRSVLKGGGGPDRLTGRNGSDVLLGGRGRDVADGSGGVDRCVAEVRRHCER